MPILSHKKYTFINPYLPLSFRLINLLSHNTHQYAKKAYLRTSYLIWICQFRNVFCISIYTMPSCHQSIIVPFELMHQIGILLLLELVLHRGMRMVWCFWFNLFDCLKLILHETTWWCDLHDYTTLSEWNPEIMHLRRSKENFKNWREIFLRISNEYHIAQNS